MFSYEFCKIFKNTFFIKHIWATVSESFIHSFIHSFIASFIAWDSDIIKKMNEIQKNLKVVPFQS